MASIKEILEFELSRDSLEMQRSIHLFQEGSFYRAYEWSAWLVCHYIHEFKVTHRRLKGIEQSVILIGFPLTSLSKWFGDNIERHDVSDKHLMLRFAEDVFSDIATGESAEDAFTQWKSQQPIVEKTSKASPDIHPSIVLLKRTFCGLKKSLSLHILCLEARLY